MTKDEILTRFNLFNENMKSQLSDRPTIGYTKKILNAYEVKIKALTEQMQYCLDCNDQQQEDINQEVVNLNEEIDKLMKVLDKKIEQDDL